MLSTVSSYRHRTVNSHTLQNAIRRTYISAFPRGTKIKTKIKPKIKTDTFVLPSFRSCSIEANLLEPHVYSVHQSTTLQNTIHSLVLYRKKGSEPASLQNLADVKGPSHSRPMLTWVQVVSTPTADTPGACVLLTFEKRRYLFGQISEGTQRLMNQRKISLSKLDELFISGPVTWNTVGGLLGMVLTIADVVSLKNVPEHTSSKKMQKKKEQGLSTIPSLKIHGAENITQTLATARRFIFRKGLPLRVDEVVHNSHKHQKQERSPDFEDSNVKVWFVSLKPEEGEATAHGRKRSHDDMVAEDNGQSIPERNTEQKENDRRLVKSVVDNMFDSDWELDALVQTTLHQVNLPAAIFVKGEDGKIQKYNGPMPGGDVPAPDIPVLTRTPWPATKISKLPLTSPSKQSVCYIVKSQSRRGKFNIEAAKMHGVQKTDYKKLTAGETVKGKDGQDVTPDMCVGESIEGRAFAFIDLPDVSYVEPFLARPEWADEAITKTIDIMYWNFGRDVVHDPRLHQFMKQRPSIKHSIFSPNNSPNLLALDSAANNMIRSNRIDPDRFPLPVFNNNAPEKAPEIVEVARVGAKLQLSPRVEFQEDLIVPLVDTMEPIRSMDPEVFEMADEARKKLSDAAFLAEIEESEKDIPNRDAEIIPLGTGSALPSKYRNVSATLVRVPGYGSYLFDSGENTIGQLRRMYGFEKAAEILRDLKVIWISHLHADHHLGTASVIKAWRDATASASSSRGGGKLPSLAVVSHCNMINWLREYAEIEDYGIDRLRLIDIKGPFDRETIQEPFICNPAITEEIGLTRIDACRVDHCHGSLACVFTWPSGLKIAYSGDCRPSKTFAQIARDCTLLLHESTLDDELKSDARAKKHCTMSEALGVARKMRARRVLLTHFSQRYPKIANASKDSDDNTVEDQVVLMAFDQMCVKLGDFKKAELFLPALRKLYEDEGGEDEPPKLD